MNDKISIENPKDGADINTEFDGLKYSIKANSKKTFDKEVGIFLLKQYSFLKNTSKQENMEDYLEKVEKPDQKEIRDFKLELGLYRQKEYGKLEKELKAFYDNAFEVIGVEVEKYKQECIEGNDLEFNKYIEESFENIDKEVNDYGIKQLELVKEKIDGFKDNSFDNILNKVEEIEKEVLYKKEQEEIIEPKEIKKKNFIRRIINYFTHNKK